MIILLNDKGTTLIRGSEMHVCLEGQVSIELGTAAFLLTIPEISTESPDGSYISRWSLSWLRVRCLLQFRYVVGLFVGLECNYDFCCSKSILWKPKYENARTSLLLRQDPCHQDLDTPTHMYIYIYIHTYIKKEIYIYIYRERERDVPMNAGADEVLFEERLILEEAIDKWTHIYIYIYMYIYIYIYIYIHVCMYMCV